MKAEAGWPWKFQPQATVTNYSLQITKYSNTPFPCKQGGRIYVSGRYASNVTVVVFLGSITEDNQLGLKDPNIQGPGPPGPKQVQKESQQGQTFV